MQFNQTVLCTPKSFLNKVKTTIAVYRCLYGILATQIFKFWYNVKLRIMKEDRRYDKNKQSQYVAQTLSLNLLFLTIPE